MSNSLYAHPTLSVRFWPVVVRNFLVWRKLAVAGIIGNVAEPLFGLVAFGYGLGPLVGPIGGQSYVTYLASGSIVASCALAASFEALYSAFSRMQVQRTWEGIMTAPIMLDDIVLAEMIWAAMKSMIAVTAIMIVVYAFGISRSGSMILAIPVLALVGVTFASIALVFNALARSYDFFTFYFTLVLTPMTFLSGVYFPVSRMAPWLQDVTRMLPLTAAVELVRPLVIGSMPLEWLRPIVVLMFYAVTGYYTALVLTRRRFAG